MIGVARPISERSQWVTLQNPGGGPGLPDLDGGTQARAWQDLDPPAVFAAIEAPSGPDLERLAAGSVLTTAAKVITMPFHPGVTTETRASWVDAAGRAHVASVTGVDNPGEACVSTVALCVEIVP